MDYEVELDTGSGRNRRPRLWWTGDEAEVLQRERFRHRSLMGGGEVSYVAVVVRRTS